MPAFRTLVLDEIIIHSIPRIRRADRGEGVGPDLSDIPVDLPADGRSYLTERLIGALLKARPVMEMPEHASPVPDQVRDAHADPATLVAQSRAMAEHLFQVESGRTSQGLVMAVRATINSDQWIVLSKIEHEKGVQVQLETTAAGERTF